MAHPIQRNILSVLVLSVGLVISSAIFVAHAQTTSTPSGIQFPVAELGNCTDVASCHAYCEKPEHILACTAFGEKNGLISKEEADRAREFSDVLKGQGPGGCTDKTTCEAYCEGSAHITECVAFAEQHHLIPPDQLAEAKKVMAALAAGGALPGGCTDKTTCEAYCKDAAHVEECLNFAEKAGFIPADQLAQAKKVLPFLKSGETPGRCTSKDECDMYCKDSAHLTECVDFAAKAGLISQEEYAIVKKTGGKGPGGCSSKEACDAFCNASANANACFEFAQAHDLIPADKLKEIKDGMGRLRSGLSQMPTEMVDCLKSNLGEDVVGKIQDGSFMPGPQAGDTIKNCVSQSLPKMLEGIQSQLKDAPDSVKQCLNTGLGSGKLDKITTGEAPSPEMGDVMRKCFEGMKTEGLSKLKEGLGKMPAEMRQCIESKLGADTVKKIEDGESVDLGPNTAAIMKECTGNLNGVMQQKMQDALKNIPESIRGCIESKLNTEEMQKKLESGAIQGPQDFQGVIGECTKDFKPEGVPSIPEGYKPQGIPSFDGFKPGELPEGVPVPGTLPGAQSGGGAPQISCSQFSMVPSCSYVPDGMARDACEKCKGQ